jgi:hypothetical protein
VPATASISATPSAWWFPPTIRRFYYGATLTPDPNIPSLFLRDGLPPNLLNPKNAANIGFGANRRESPIALQPAVESHDPARVAVRDPAGGRLCGANAHKIPAHL